jgi:hypothetical protein
MKSGNLLGHPGLNFSQRNSLHFEIFTDDSIVKFIEDHDDLDLSDKNILQVNKGSKLFQRAKINVPKASATIKKYSRIKVEDDDASSEYVKIMVTDTCGIVKRADMEGYDSSSNQYKGIKVNLEKYQSKISADLTESSHLEFIYYSNGTGDLKTADTHDGHRLVAFPIAEAEQKTYWVKRDLINSQNITTDDVDKGVILFNSLNDLYEENPIKYIFQEESPSGSSDEALVDLATRKSCQDSDGEIWYEVKLPFDNKGLLHYLSVLLGVNRTAQEKGWIKASDTELTTTLNWPGFKIAKETGKGSQDAKIDYKNLTPFFKELFEDIDTSGNGSISAKEMKAALQDNILADRLSRVIAKHPSEWQTDASLSKWEYLKDLVPDDAAFEEAKTQIKNLAWWDDAKVAGADLPMSPEVYHLHPLSAIEQLSYLIKLQDIFLRISVILDVEVAAIKAVAFVESRGDSFLGSGHPKILFESHQFRKFTSAAYDESHPLLSHKYKDANDVVIRNYIGGEGEVTQRLNIAIGLNSEAAYLSASWGKFQIMGFNHEKAGYSTVDEFVVAMKDDINNHYLAFGMFLKSNTSMHQALKAKNWARFSELYNGSDYASNSYDLKMKNAYERFKNDN